MAISQAHIIESLGQACSTLNRDEFIFSFLDAYGFPKNTITRLRNGGDNRNVTVKFFETPRSVFLLPCSARKLLAVDCLERSVAVHSCRSLRCIR